MADVGLAILPGDRQARVLIGGLGLGFTLQRVLELARASLRIEVIELIPEVVAWHRELLPASHREALEDPRVRVRIGDAVQRIREMPAGSCDAMLLDVDNGPVAMVAANNSWLYSPEGLRAVRGALRPGGRAVFWSASADEAFAARLRRAKFSVEAIPAKLHEGAKRAAYMLYSATRS